MRIQVSSRSSVGDGRADALVRRLQTLGSLASAAVVSDIFIVDGVPSLTAALARELFCDPVAQTVRIDDDAAPDQSDWSFVVEVTYRPGVTDPVATSVRDALASEFGSLPTEAVVQTGRQYFLRVAPEATGEPAPAPFAAHLHNPLIEHATVITRAEWESGIRPPSHYPTVAPTSVPPVDRIDVAAMSDAQLDALSRDRLLALSRAELTAVRGYYASEAVRAERERTGIGAAATDVELEMIAQTWSEHCKHKIFAAKVRYRETDTRGTGGRTGDDGGIQEIDGLFRTYIKATTDAVGDERFVKSVFHDNAGVIRFDDDTLVCIKAETHNSPSALDPYGGAITGIVGVNRDIMGTGKGARPIFNTDVLCFGHHDTPGDRLPDGLLHPRVVMEGVHRGIVDGGNQSGIPVAAGAFLFDESYTGKPLVFCGTGGVLPATVDGEPSWIKHTEPGDLAVMVGGRIGKDGIHGATFSSLALDETSPTSAVQIGEPITQKKMAEFLLEARDRLLYKGITDNGAGGLSSSFGEMARDSGGVRIDLDGCPLKYPGLAAWEILVSESQERMSLAVSPSTWPALSELAARHGVEVSVVGEFTDSGNVLVTHRGEVVADLSLGFLHDGVPQMVLDAAWPGPGRVAPPSAGFERAADLAAAASPRTALLALLADPNIGSKEQLVRQYDHEVQAGSVVKPFCGRDANAPTDGGVIRPRLDSTQGLTVTHGICPRYGDRDTYEMAVAAVDEAVRAHVVLGGDPARMAALDNFCWPDPVVSESTPDGAYKMAQLVRACRGLADACRAYRLPLVSGKDSMKNDARLGGVKVSIRPTLLVTLTGIVPDVRRALTSAFVAPGDRIFLLGGDEPVLSGSAYERICGRAVDGGDSGTGAPSADAPAPTVIGSDGKTAEELDANARLYAALHGAIRDGLVASAHDLSDGGFAVAIAECAIGGGLGAEVTLPAADDRAVPALFGERFGRIVVTVATEDAVEFARRMDGVRATDIGTVTDAPRVAISAPDPIEWSLTELTDAWNAFGRSIGADDAPRTVHAGDAATASQEPSNPSPAD
ncbi:MAG: phosphoribosylformylglycinamidine synthase, partial [Spirochaetaceae bacterium]